MILSFRLNEEQLASLNWAAQIAFKTLLQGEAPDDEDIRELMLFFVEDGNGGFQAPAAARRTLGRLSTEQVLQAVKLFSEAASEWAVPKETGRPLQQEPTDSEPPPHG